MRAGGNVQPGETPIQTTSHPYHEHQLRVYTTERYEKKNKGDELSKMKAITYLN